ncbi:MAG: 3-phosphoshikimate 1-carboxyvinyltransferase [Acidimicrobiales bacterium]
MSGPADRAVQPITARRGPLDAVVTVPGSKSITNRALLVAALAEGPSVLHGVLDADDTAAMVDCLQRLGVAVALDPVAEQATVEGAGGRWPALAIPDRMVWLDARQSGTTARFLPPALALGEGGCTLDGAEQLRARPFGPLIGALRDLGVDVQAAGGSDGGLPLVVQGGSRARWPAEVAIGGDVSSQFLSGLMMAAPLAPHGLRIRLTTPLVSVPYVTMTAQVMAAFGAPAAVGDGLVEVPAGRYTGRAHRVEGDASAASYFFAAAAICGGTVRVQGLGRHSVQGDAAFADVLAAMGCTVRRGEDWTEVTGPAPGGLRGVTVDLADLSDTAPTLAAVAPFADGPTTMTGIGFIRRKESDRIGAVVGELRRLGIAADELDDGMTVHPAGPAARGTTVQTYDDHRLAMSFAVVGLRLAGTVVADPGCVAKTFPRFWDVFATLSS